MSTEMLLKATEKLTSTEQLADLQIKFEAKENKYKTMQLENNEYKIHVMSIT